MFAAAKGGRYVEAEAIAEDDLDDDEGVSVKRPWMGRDPDDPANRAGNGCKTRAIKGGRGAPVGTGWPKAGQDPDDQANWTGNKLPKARPAKVPPKSGRGIPIEIVNEDGSSGDKVSLANKDKFVSEEGDNKRDPDKDIAAAARLALGVEGLRPSNEARAAVARLPGTVIVRRALVALRDDTNNEASSAATSNSKAAAQATLHDGMEPTRKPTLRPTGRPKRGATQGKKPAGPPRGSPTKRPTRVVGLPAPKC